MKQRLQLWRVAPGDREPDRLTLYFTATCSAAISHATHTKLGAFMAGGVIEERGNGKKKTKKKKTTN